MDRTKRNGMPEGMPFFFCIYLPAFSLQTLVK